MAACFKLPSLAKRPRRPSQFLEFEWRVFKTKAELGCETFGSDYLVKYGREDRGNVIVKKKMKVRFLVVFILLVRILLVRVLPVCVLPVLVLPLRV